MKSALPLFVTMYLGLLAPAPAAGQELSPMARWLVKMSSIRQELLSVKIPDHYCKPPQTPQKPPDVSRLRKIGLDLREAENELFAIERAYGKELPQGQRLMADDPRIKNYPPIGKVDIVTGGASTTSMRVPYFAAAWSVFQAANSTHRVKQDTVERMEPRTCVDPGSQAQPATEDPLAGLDPPRYSDISLPLPAPCYQSAETKRRVYNRAYQEEQEANTNVNMADAYIQAIRDRLVLHANQNGPAATINALKQALATAEDQRNTRRTEFENANARLMVIDATPVPCPSGSQSASPRSRVTKTVLGGTGFGSGANAPATPPAAGPAVAVPGGRTHTTVPTLQVSPGKEMLDEILDLLDEADWLDYFGYFEEAEYVEWEAWDLMVGLRMSFSFREIVNAEPRLRPYVEGYLSYLNSAASIRRLLQNAQSVHDIMKNGLLNANATSTVSLRTSDNGGYKTGLRFGGGVEFDLRRQLIGFKATLRTGVSALVPIGSPREQTFAIDSGFTASGVSFAQTDEATFTTSLGTSWGVNAGLSLSRPLSGRMAWSIDVDVEARHGSSTVTLTTNPVTTSSQPGAIVFATPAGSRTIVISTIPGVPSTVSAAVTNHELAKSSGWSVGPAFRVGITF